MDQETAFGAFIAMAAAKAAIAEPIKDLYKAGKDMLRRLCGKGGEDAAAALEEVERVPDSPSLQNNARSALLESGAMQFPELLAHLEKLAASMAGDQTGAQIINQAYGQGAIAAGKIGTVVQGDVHGQVNGR